MSSSTVGGLGDGEWLASTEDGSATTREAVAGTAGPSGSRTGATGIALEYGSMEPEAHEELTAPPEAA